ncbi:hypothetical protein [Pseudomonas sp. JAI120]|uniref:hypothetical protein n=1 Tax=Pseudomonas sp. JAI120 TaxID=2723063 RepID=UPI0030D94F58
MEGNQTTPKILAHCAQQLIKVAGHLVEARSDEDPECWVVACNMVTCCVYTDKARYLGHTQPFDYEYFRQTRITRRSQHDR